MAGLPSPVCPAAVNPFALSSKQLFPPLDQAFDVVREDTHGSELPDHPEIDLVGHPIELPVSDGEFAVIHEKEKKRQDEAEEFWRQASDVIAISAATCGQTGKRSGTMAGEYAALLAEHCKQTVMCFGVYSFLLFGDITKWCLNVV
jgi:hypothetical protein